MFKTIGFIFCAALIFLAGCATTPTTETPLEWTDTNAMTNPPVVLTNKPAPPLVWTNPPVVHTNPPPTPIATWVSLNDWATENNIGSPHKLASLPVATYAIGSKYGVMVLTIGTRDAAWNGSEIHLGFAPEFIDGQVFVHGLDLQKNLGPLLLNPPLIFSPTNQVIVLDPGHGGKETGTISVLDQRPEKEFTLDLARRLKPLLETNGWTVFLTRTNDTEMSLSNRVAFAELHHADYFISLHFNSAAPSKKENGLETYCLTPTGMPSTLTRGYADIWTDHYPNNNFDAENVRFATQLHSAILHAAGEDDRGVSRARFMGVLRGQKRPAILIEGGFLSNPEEATKIESAEFRQKLAQAIADALK